MKIVGLDHIVLTVRDFDRTIAFYCNILGMVKKVSPGGRVALHFGSQKINLHQAGAEFEPCAKHPTPGSADLCFIIDGSIEELTGRLEACCVSLVDGPVERTGAQGSIMSLYVRDPDNNLIELSRYR